ncbi:Uncharacterized protein HZ326_20657 [Fusarium oxysporum f. sp. albedinis]|nr:Uncharacterized protein HZ326_20657 [Fusarium oxysporum f. sp. albedinis]
MLNCTGLSSLLRSSWILALFYLEPIAQGPLQYTSHSYEPTLVPSHDWHLVPLQCQSKTQFSDPTPIHTAPTLIAHGLSIYLNFLLSIPSLR